MNDLPWIKYRPDRMYLDLLGMSKDGKVAHVALFNYTLINDGPPVNDNETLREITNCQSADWARVKRELIGKGWVESSKYFLHRGTIKTLNESKETFVENQNRTAAANKLPRLELLPPDSETGCVTYRVTPNVTLAVTLAVALAQEQKQKHEQTNPHYSASKSVLGDSKGGRVATDGDLPKPAPVGVGLMTMDAIPRTANLCLAGAEFYDNCKVKAEMFTTASLVAVLRPYAGKVNATAVITTFAKAVLSAHQRCVDAVGREPITKPGALVIRILRDELDKRIAGESKEQP